MPASADSIQSTPAVSTNPTPDHTQMRTKPPCLIRSLCRSATKARSASRWKTGALRGMITDGKATAARDKHLVSGATKRRKCRQRRGRDRPSARRTAQSAQIRRIGASAGPPTGSTAKGQTHRSFTRSGPTLRLGREGRSSPPQRSRGFYSTEKLCSSTGTTTTVALVRSTSKSPTTPAEKVLITNQ